MFFFSSGSCGFLNRFNRLGESDHIHECDRNGHLESNRTAQNITSADPHFQELGWKLNHDA